MLEEKGKNALKTDGFAEKTSNLKFFWNLHCDLARLGDLEWKNGGF